MLPSEHAMEQWNRGKTQNWIKIFCWNFTRFVTEYVLSLITTCDMWKEEYDVNLPKTSCARPERRAPPEVWGEGSCINKTWTFYRNIHHLAPRDGVLSRSCSSLKNVSQRFFCGCVSVFRLSVFCLRSFGCKSAFISEKLHVHCLFSRRLQSTRRSTNRSRCRGDTGMSCIPVSPVVLRHCRMKWDEQL